MYRRELRKSPSMRHDRSEFVVAQGVGTCRAVANDAPSCLRRRRGAQGRERSRGHHQDEAHHPVRGLVPHRLQVWHQLPAAHCRARRA